MCLGCSRAAASLTAVVNLSESDGDNDSDGHDNGDGDGDGDGPVDCDDENAVYGYNETICHSGVLSATSIIIIA